jgi:hypothetical protein
MKPSFVPGTSELPLRPAVLEYKRPCRIELVRGVKPDNMSTAWRLRLTGFVLTLILFSFSGLNAQTIVRGTVQDARTGEPIPFASIYFKGGTGQQSDSLGRFEIVTYREVSELSISYLGYKTLSLPVNKGTSQTVVARLQLDEKKDLNTVVVKNKGIRYTNKNNPAVELIRRVIANKGKNRAEQYDFVEYEQYEKTLLSLSRVSNKLGQSKLLKRYQFLFENTDTVSVPGKALTPVYLEEKLSSRYYRKEGRQSKTVLQGEKRVNFGEFIDSAGVSAYLNRIYEEVDVYDNSISVFTNQFLSPIADFAPSFYMYFIRDTITDASGRRLVKLYFTPRNTNDFLFRGTLFVTLDTNYAVQKLDMTVSPNINMNWVRELYIKQEFEKNENDERYHLVKSDMLTEAGLTRGKSGGIYGRKTITYRNYRINQPRPSTFYEGPSLVKEGEGLVRTDSFWIARRHDGLNPYEQRVYKNIDSLRNMRSFQRTLDWATLLLAGYKSFGPFEVGPASTFYSFNPVEGFRLRFGGRTTPTLSKRFYFETYAAYGFRDERWKGFFSFTYSLNNKSVYSFPLSYLRVSAQRETRIPGQELQFVQEDNFLLSFKRGRNDRWLYNDIYRFDFVQEFTNRFSIGVGFKNWKQSPAGAISYDKNSPLGEESVPSITTSEATLLLRWAPNEQFYQGKIYRIPIINRYPIFTFRYARGIRGVFNGQYNYDQFNLSVSKRVFLSQFGFSDVFLEGSYLRGQVPFALLSIHRANQTYALQLQSYNLMNFLEFVSDRYAAVNIDHHFNGFLFNRVPLLQKLNLREIISMKVLWGAVRDENRGDVPGQIRFPRDPSGVTTTFSLNGQPYVEGSVGIGNIFRLLRLDLVKRFTYLDNPVVAEWGIRGRVRVDF